VVSPCSSVISVCMHYRSCGIVASAKVACTETKMQSTRALFNTKHCLVEAHEVWLNDLVRPQLTAKVTPGRSTCAADAKS
jgi:hypothetical protein